MNIKLYSFLQKEVGKQLETSYELKIRGDTYSSDKVKERYVYLSYLLEKFTEDSKPSLTLLKDEENGINNDNKR